MLVGSAEARELAPGTDHPGIFRYADWLPVRKVPLAAGMPAVFRSQTLADRLGLEHLVIAFSGYWPEKGATFETCSFKELEALTVTARVPEAEGRTMVVSSAGNTGMAFLQVCSELGVPVVVVVPQTALPGMWITNQKHPAVTLAVLSGQADYLDAIQLANLIAQQDGYFAEGGAKNVARRDGMGTVLLSAVEVMGVLPHHYVQAIGSGTGGIAAWEMSQRLIADGRYGDQRMRLHLVQNAPFAIMADAWQDGAAELPPLDEADARNRISRVYAGVLSNRQPPYAITGGVYDALKDSGGFTYQVTNEDAIRAAELFETLEGCDLHPAAAVALAGLQQAVASGRIKSRDSVLFNATGGGIKKIEAAGCRLRLEPDIVFSKGDATLAGVAAKMAEFHRVRSR